jgi:hypothetical protein
MSYTHCPTCSRAYNLALVDRCPSCPIPATVVDPAEDIVAAAEQLARAMARATPDERDDAMARMDRLALPPPSAEGSGPISTTRGRAVHGTAKPGTFHGAMLRSIREALDPPPAPPSAPQPRFAQLAIGLIARIKPHVEKRAPRLLEGFYRARDRVRALAA